MRRARALALPMALGAIAVWLLVDYSNVPLIQGDRAGITCIAAPHDYYERRAHLIHLSALFGWAAVLTAGATVAWLRGCRAPSRSWCWW